MGLFPQILSAKEEVVGKLCSWDVLTKSAFEGSGIGGEVGVFAVDAFPILQKEGMNTLLIEGMEALPIGVLGRGGGGVVIGTHPRKGTPRMILQPVPSAMGRGLCRHQSLPTLLFARVDRLDDR